MMKKFVHWFVDSGFIFRVHIFPAYGRALFNAYRQYSQEWVPSKTAVSQGTLCFSSKEANSLFDV